MNKTKYLLIESRDPLESRDSEHYLFALATTMARAGGDVAVLLVQNGACVARREARYEALAAAIEAGVRVYADEFALRERGIDAARLALAVRPTPLDMVIDRLLDGSRVIWH